MRNNSNYHDVYFKPNKDREVVWREICLFLSKYIKKEDSVLEMGAGYCDFINNVKARKRMAVDIWPGIKSYAQTGVETKVLDLSKGLKTKEQYDVVLASNLLEHLEMDKAKKLLSDVFELLKPEGRLIIIQPNFALNQKNYFDDYTHKTVFTDITLTTLLDKIGFETKKMERGFLPYTLKSKFPKWPWIIRLYMNLPIKPFAGQMLIVASK